MARLAQKVKDKAVGRSRTKVVRRTNAERSEATRERVIAAAIHVLHTRGYSGATTLAIQEAAEMSLGALQHQFPTKAKLMAAVAERFCEHRFKRYDEAARAGTDPLDCVKRMLDVTGALLRDGEFVSGLEIALAKRNDPELEVALRPLKRYDDQMKELLDKIARDANLSEEFWNKNAVVLSNAVARGLAVEMLGGGDRASVVGAFAMWRQMVLDIFAREMKPRRRGA